MCFLTLLTGTRNRIRQGRIPGALLLGACLVLQAQQITSLENTAAAAQRDPPKVPTHWISFRDGLLGIEARQAPWVKVLEEIRKKTEIHFHYSVPLEGSVTLSFAALPVKQALEHLFGPDASFIFRYPDMAGGSLPSALPTEVWVLGEAGDGGSEAIRTASGKPEGELAASGNNTPADPGQVFETPDNAAEQAAPPDDAQEVEEDPDQLIEMAKDEDPEVRLQALLALSDGGKADEDTIRSALDAALTDKDVHVRGYAIQALARRAGPDAMGLLWQALRDPDSSVRVMAVDSVRPSNDQGIALLREALSDADETVRSVAASQLNLTVNAAGPMR